MSAPQTLMVPLKVRQLETDLAMARAQVTTLQSELATLRAGVGDIDARAIVEVSK